jgi:hypothetical protein
VKLQKVLIHQANMAVEAVISEPVSASYFPVSRENTGNFFGFSLGNGLRIGF